MGSRDVLGVTVAATAAFLSYLSGSSDDRLAVMISGVGPSASTDASGGGVDPAAREPLLDRLQHLQLRDVVDTLTEPGRVLADVISVVFPGGSTADSLQLAAALFGAVTVAVLVTIMRRLDVACTAAIASGLGFAFHQHTWLHAVLPDSRMGSAPLLSLSVLVLLFWSETRRAGLLWIGIACWALSIAVHPLLVCTAPVVVWFACTAPSREPRGTFLASTVSGRVLRIGGFLAITGAGMAATGTADLSRVYDLLSSEFGVLGLLFLSGGLVHHLWLRPDPRSLLLSLSFGAVIGWASVSATSEATLFPAALLFACPIVGHGMSVVVRSRAGRTHAAAATAVLLALPTVNVISHRDSVHEARDEHARDVRHARASAAVLPAGAAVATFSSQQESLPPLWQVSEPASPGGVELPWDVLRIRDMVLSRPTFALEPTRARLDLLGFRFERPFSLRVARPLDSYLQGLAPGTIVAVVADGDAVARAGALLQDTVRVIGGGRNPPVRGYHYGLFGLARGAAIAEESSPVGVDLRLEAGEVLDDNGRLLKVTLQIERAQGRVRISIDGEPVLTDPDGVGVVVLRSDDAVEKVAVAYEHDDVLWILDEARRSYARLLDWEPCSSIGAEGWTDVSRLLAGNGAGILFSSPSAATSVALYVWREDRPLVLRRGASSAPRTSLTFETFDRTVQAENASLERLLEFDGIAPGHRMRQLRFVQLLHVNPQENKSSLTEIRFNGNVLSGMARLLGSADAGRVTICGGR